jgi:hypothetical protein
MGKYLNVDGVTLFKNWHWLSICYAGKTANVTPSPVF